MRFLALLLLVLLSPALALAGPFEDGNAAYEHHDYQTALKFWQPLADQGNADVQFRIGLMHVSGEGFTKDTSEGMKWLRKAAEQGHIRAQYFLGQIYGKGGDVPKDSKESIKWYRKAAEQGDLMAQVNLGATYMNGDGVPEDDAEALKWVRMAANQGDPGAEYNLGRSYANGWGVTKDFKEAYFWLSLAAPHKNIEPAETERNEDEIYLTKEEIESVKKRVAEWKPSPTSPPAPVLDELDQAKTAYEQHDLLTAFKKFSELAEKGNAEAEAYLGSMYDLMGGGPVEDDKRALELLRLRETPAAETGIGGLYERGAAGLPVDHSKAMKWYSKAAAEGDFAAQSNLGIKYMHGEGLVPDNVQAYMWFTLSVQKKESKWVRQQLQELASKMTPTQIEQAKKFIADWKRIPVTPVTMAP